MAIPDSGMVRREEPPDRQPPPAGPDNFVARHWRGEYSLARTYWVHGALLTLVVRIATFFVEVSLVGQWPSTVKLASIAMVVTLGVISIWQMVGIWRSAGNAIERSGRAFWGTVARILVVLGAVGTVVNTGEAMSTVGKLTRALNDPLMVAATVDSTGPGELSLNGAINESSGRRILDAIAEDDVRHLTITSPGGLEVVAEDLAEAIHEARISVTARDYCISGCVLLMAASPNVAVWPDTAVIFHRPEFLIEPELVDLLTGQVKPQTHPESFVRYGIAGSAIEEANKHLFWPVSLAQQIDMGLTDKVYDPARGEPVDAAHYCTAADCDAIPDLESVSRTIEDGLR